MYDEKPGLFDLARQVSRWDGEGGAIPRWDAVYNTSLPNADTLQLRARIIALENIVIALLAQASVGEGDHVREMAEHISPRPNCEQHVLTTVAASRMNDLVERADHFRKAMTLDTWPRER